MSLVSSILLPPPSINISEAYACCKTSLNSSVLCTEMNFLAITSTPKVLYALREKFSATCIDELFVVFFQSYLKNFNGSLKILFFQDISNSHLIHSCIRSRVEAGCRSYHYCFFVQFKTLQ